ncbi:hypothetical protein Vadar_008322 [Vaccinium darrowii]|uniref:Uncharacterized protein n=1 Tax=Vaccinium darrowii TaxID=229202 RepID=A0ACB7WZ41_9ERIC|nr:hypothetical protein Vadar_008322 [Vaccinium darrowii]
MLVGIYSGRLSEKSFAERSITFKEDMLKRKDGMRPVSPALCRARTSRLTKFANSCGISPATQIGEVALAIKKLSDDQLDVKDLYAEVMKTKGFDEFTLASAFDHLVENEKMAKAFTVKSARLRRAWLEGFFNMNA